MTKEFCDLCRKELVSCNDFCEYKVKVKKKWHSWHESGWSKITVCPDCKESLIKFKNTMSAFNMGFEAGVKYASKEVE